MGKHKIKSSILIFFLTALLLISYGCKEPIDLKSRWLDKEIIIDANDNEWTDFPFYNDKKTRTCVGIYNDDANLYVCLRNMDKDIQRKITGQGLYIWFNKTGGKDKQLAVVYPIGGEPGWLGGPQDSPTSMQGNPIDRSSDMPGPSSEGPSNDQNMPQMKPFGHDSASKLRILTSEDDTGRTYNMQEAANVGIYVGCMVDQKNRFIYELKIPVIDTNNTPYAAVASAANNIGMGFMTANAAKGPRRGGRPGGGRPGGDMPGDTGSRGKSLEIWTNVTLASDPSTEKRAGNCGLKPIRLKAEDTAD